MSSRRCAAELECFQGSPEIVSTRRVRQGKGAGKNWTRGLVGGAARRGDPGENRRARASCGVSACVCVCAGVWKHAESADGSVVCLET